MSRPLLPVLKYLLSVALMTGCLPAAMAASPPTLFSMASGKAEVLARGAQKSWPIKVSEDNAFDAVFQGGMWLPNPAGGRIYAKYQRHILHANGTWTWVGTVETAHGQQSVVLTFGKDGVFGLVPQTSGYPLRIVSNATGTHVVETSATVMAQSAQALRLYSAPDYVIPPKPGRSVAQATTATTSAQAAAPMPAGAAASGAVTVDVMVAYTPGFVTELGSQAQAMTRIQNLVDTTNQAYLASGVNLQIRLVDTVQVNYPDNTSNQSALDDITGIDSNGNLVPVPASLQSIASLRDQYGADLVTLIRSYDNATQGDCGVGWLIGGNQTAIVPSQQKPYGYNVVSDGSNGGYFCLDTTFAHELGHNMGSAHDRANATESGAYSYSYGYLGNGTNGFSTIMAYGTQTTPLAVFSNPNISTCQNTPCGVADSASNSADNAHSLNNTASLIAQFEPTMVGTLPPAGAFVQNDVNGDGKSDLLWRSQSGSQFAYWIMNGVTVTGGQAFGANSAYRMAAAGDFNGDGILDLIWTNGSSIYEWVGDGSGYTSKFIGYYDSRWNLVGAADIDGDGKSDLLWHSPALSSFSYWIMDGVKPVRAAVFPISSVYRFAGSGDFNGDKKSDIVWTDGSSIYIWLGNGSNFTSKLVGYYGDGWKLVDVADVDGDGESDLLFHNRKIGSFAYWILQNGLPVKSAVFPIGVQFSIGAVGDFNGDGKADVMWTNGAALYEWQGNGNGFSSFYVSNYGNGWSLIQTGEAP